MTATLIDGKAIAQQVRSEVRAEVEEWTAGGHHPPGLATILVGDDPASAVYVANKQKACVEVGMGGFSHDLPAHTSQAEVERLIGELGADARVSGILLQLPTPDHIDGPYLTTLIPPARTSTGSRRCRRGCSPRACPGCGRPRRRA